MLLLRSLEDDARSERDKALLNKCILSHDYLTPLSVAPPLRLGADCPTFLEALFWRAGAPPFKGRFPHLLDGKFVPSFGRQVAPPSFGRPIYPSSLGPGYASKFCDG